MVFGGRTLGRRLHHEGEGLMNEISALIKETPENIVSPQSIINRINGHCSQGAFNLIG